MIDIILITVILLVIGTATWYIYKEKKKGNRIYFILMTALPLITDLLFFSTIFLVGD